MPGHTVVEQHGYQREAAAILGELRESELALTRRELMFRVHLTEKAAQNRLTRLLDRGVIRRYRSPFDRRVWVYTDVPGGAD